LTSKTPAVLLAVLAFAACGGAADEATSDARGRRVFEPAKILVRPNGELLVPGIASLGGEGWNCGGQRLETTEFVVLRLKPSGNVTGHFEVAQEAVEWCAEAVEEAALLADGTLVLGGSIRGPPSEGGADRGFVTARFLRSGELDPAWEELATSEPTADVAGELLGGRNPIIDAGGEVHGLARLDRGVVIGSYDVGYPVYGLHAFTARGAPDRDFGRAGSVSVPFGPRDSPSAELVDVEATSTGIYPFANFAPFDENANYRYLLYRHGRGGAIDRSYGRRGRVLLNPNLSRFEITNGIALQRDGRALAVGQLDEGPLRKLFVARLTRRGERDTTWGRRGLVLRTLGRRTDDLYSDARAAVAVQRDGKVVVAASIRGRPTRVYRFLPDGRPDRRFANGGVATVARV
jgi:uncharacterized delta-60 repeat protein